MTDHDAVPVPAEELEALRRDAARYRYYRSKSEHDFDVSWDGTDEGFGPELDNAIDRAMSAPADDEIHDQPRAMALNQDDEDLHLDNAQRSRDQNKER